MSMHYLIQIGENRIKLITYEPLPLPAINWQLAPHNAGHSLSTLGFDFYSLPHNLLGLFLTVVYKLLFNNHTTYLFKCQENS
jgi:hypothetical protein